MATRDEHLELRVTATPTAEPPLGASRFGGDPDLPRGTAWPRHRWTRAETTLWPGYAQDQLVDAIGAGIVVDEGATVAMALGFVAQLDLAALAPLQDVLPRDGHLWLFADQGTHAGEREGYPVIACAAIHAAGAELVRVASPPVAEPITPAVLAITRGDAAGPRHAILPAPDLGTSMVPPPGYVGLLRIDTDDALGTHWGDAAWLTFAIGEDALARGALDRIVAFRFIG